MKQFHDLCCKIQLVVLNFILIFYTCIHVLKHEVITVHGCSIPIFSPSLSTVIVGIVVVYGVGTYLTGQNSDPFTTEIHVDACTHIKLGETYIIKYVYIIKHTVL